MLHVLQRDKKNPGTSKSKHKSFFTMIFVASSLNILWLMNGSVIGHYFTMIKVFPQNCTCFWGFLLVGSEKRRRNTRRSLLLSLFLAFHFRLFLSILHLASLLDAVFFSESPFEEVGHANVGGRVSGRPRASATTTSPRYQGQNTGRRMSLLFSANEEVASHSANIMKAPLSYGMHRGSDPLLAFRLLRSLFLTPALLIRHSRWRALSRTASLE